VLTRTVSKWIETLGQTESFLEPKLSQLSDQTLIKDRDVVIQRIAAAIRSGESIVVFGDYDCDGMTSVAILTEALRMLGGRVTPMVASRFSGGYGLSQPAAEKVKSSGATLLITCDCGSSDHDRLQFLKDAGVDTLVIDHHLVPSKPLPALGFLNPHRPECQSTFKWMASCGLALSVVGGLNRFLGAGLDTRQWLDLVAIGTVADVAPLTGDNRILVRSGLKELVKPKRPALGALYQLTNFSPEGMLTGRDIGFRVAPAVNAPGRMGPPDIILDLFMEKDPIRARAVAEDVKNIWDKRREDTETITNEATDEVLRTSKYTGGHAIVVGREEWNHGIVGIVAARLVEKFNVPVACIGSEGRGSLRGPAGSTLYDALCHCKDTLEVYGGHQAAAGCKVDWSRLQDFREKFNEFFSKQVKQSNTANVSETLALDTNDDMLSVANDINRLEPCGQGNPRPLLLVTGQVKSHRVLKEKHLKLELLLTNGLCIGAFGVNKAEFVDSLSFGSTVQITGDLRKNTWNGRTKVEIFISSINIVA
jgi:single-stranded-DNA-specific exonuclease